MRAGALKIRLKVFKPATTPTRDTFGAVVPSFVEYGTIHAERVSVQGFRSQEAGELFDDYRAQFNVRDAHDIKPLDRLQQLGTAEVFSVTSIIRNINRGFLTLNCERVNE